MKIGLFMNRILQSKKPCDKKCGVKKYKHLNNYMVYKKDCVYKSLNKNINYFYLKSYMI